jgi:pimeloyl-ACP methyl ester carboxylesterase
MHGLDPSIEGAILLSPPLRFSTDEHLDAWAESGKPVLALVPELDDYLRPDEARERFARIPQAEVVGVDGAKHLWVGEPAVRRVLDEIVKRVAPDAYPLPTEWPSPVEAAPS